MCSSGEINCFCCWRSMSCTKDPREVMVGGFSSACYFYVNYFLGDSAGEEGSRREEKWGSPKRLLVYFFYRWADRIANNRRLKFEHLLEKQNKKKKINDPHPPHKTRREALLLLSLLHNYNTVKKIKTNEHLIWNLRALYITVITIW